MLPDMATVEGRPMHTDIASMHSDRYGHDMSVCRVCDASAAVSENMQFGSMNSFLPAGGVCAWLHIYSCIRPHRVGAMIQPQAHSSSDSEICESRSTCGS
jgi:hypothetical protein